MYDARMVETFGNRLKALRDRAGWSQDAFAQLVNQARPGWKWHQTTVGRIERGEREVKVDELVAIAEVLNMELDAVVLSDAEHRVLDQMTEIWINLRLEGPRLARIRELDWQIQIVRERLSALQAERANEIHQLSRDTAMATFGPDPDTYEPDDVESSD